jgi:hypothetical protein
MPHHLHDSGYKFLFSHDDLVRELLEVFAPPGQLERPGKHFHSTAMVKAKLKPTIH